MHRRHIAGWSRLLTAGRFSCASADRIRESRDTRSDRVGEQIGPLEGRTQHEGCARNRGRDLRWNTGELKELDRRADRERGECRTCGADARAGEGGDHIEQGRIEGISRESRRRSFADAADDKAGHDQDDPSECEQDAAAGHSARLPTLCAHAIHPVTETRTSVGGSLS
jgi:hypothetical protein